MSKPLTRKDIARNAGVSPSTVSRALSGSPLLPERTISKIRALAKRMGLPSEFVSQTPRQEQELPDRLRRPFRRRAGRERSTCRTIPTSWTAWCTRLTSEATLSRSSLCLTTRRRSSARCAGLLDARTVDGLVIVGITSEIPLLGDLDAGGLPCVLVGAASPKALVPSVTYTPEKGINEMLAALEAKRYKRLFHVCGPERYHDAVTQKSSLIRAIPRSRLTMGGARGGNYSIKSGWEAAVEFMPRARPGDCFFLANDRMAAGFYHYCQEKGIGIPGDAGVVGCDDEDIALILSPELSTIRQPRREMGEAAADALVDLLDIDAQGRPQICLPANFIQRGSI